MSTTDNPLGWIDDALQELERASLRRRIAVRSSSQAANVVLDGRALVNFGSNDYLGLAADQRLIDAANAACQREGWGGGASALVSGRSGSQAELEKRLAEFEGTEAALYFSTGFATNASIIPALVDEGDAIFCDAKNHASLIDGSRLSKAMRLIYPHCDCDALEAMLKRDAGQFRRRLIATDTVFSMDGDVAPMARISELAQTYNSMLMVDEAHATGVFGLHGRGVFEEVEASGHAVGVIRVGTLSKALGSAGGFVCGSRPLIEWLANRARSHVFSTAMPAAVCAAGIAALDIARSEPFRREQLLSRAAELRARLNEQGWNTGSSRCQIIPLVVGDADRAVALAARLREAGYFVPAIRPPTVPQGESLLRISLCYHHTPEMVDALLGELARLR